MVHRCASVGLLATLMTAPARAQQALAAPVYLESSKPQRLRLRNSALHIDMECFSPCDLDLPFGKYRLTGTTHSFDQTFTVGAPTALRVEPTDHGKAFAGALLFVAGMGAFGVGLLGLFFLMLPQVPRERGTVE